MSTPQRPTFYTGVGNRKSPLAARGQCTEIAQHLAARGLVLRTGDALGIDAAFKIGAAPNSPTDPEPEVYAPASRTVWDWRVGHHVRSEGAPPEWALELAQRLVPVAEKLRPMPVTTWALFARSMQQVLGADGQSPSAFLLCWTAFKDPTGPNAGGTRLAVRCAQDTAARAALGLPANPIPWLNVNGATLDEVLAFAEQHTPRP